MRNGGRTNGRATSAAPPAFDVAEPHRRLGRERPGHRLANGERLLVLGLGVPAPSLHKIAVHVADEGDRAPEAPCP